MTEDSAPREEHTERPTRPSSGTTGKNPGGTKNAGAKNSPDDTATNGTEGRNQSVRTEKWACSGPAELDLWVDIGRIEVVLTDDASTVEATLRADASLSGLSRGLSGVLDWLNEVGGPSGSIRLGGREIKIGGGDFGLSSTGINLGEHPARKLGESLAGAVAEKVTHTGTDTGTDSVAENLIGSLTGTAVRSAQVSWTEVDRRLVVRSSPVLPSRMVPLAVTVRAPSHSRLTLRTGTGEIVVTGRAGTTSVRTGSGELRLEEVLGDLELATGSGRAKVNRVAGRLTAKSGSGDLSLGALTGPTDVRTGSGNLRLGRVRADVTARTGSGDLTVEDAEEGQLELTTGSGNLHVGVHPGVAAELDLRTGSGRARSELAVSDTAPEGTATTLRISGRTGQGDALVTKALVTKDFASENGR